MARHGKRCYGVGAELGGEEEGDEGGRRGGEGSRRVPRHSRSRSLSHECAGVICAGYEMDGGLKERMTRVRRESRRVFRNEERLMLSDLRLSEYLYDSKLADVYSIDRIACKFNNPSVVDGVER